MACYKYIILFLDVEKVSYPRFSQKALNRWGVAYTLIHNSRLVQYTAANLALEKENQKKKKRTTPVQLEADDVSDKQEGRGPEDSTLVLPESLLGNFTTFITGVEPRGAGEAVEMVHVSREGREEEEVGAIPDNGGLGGLGEERTEVAESQNASNSMLEIDTDHVNTANP